MTPQRALELVGRYARLTREMKSLTKTIGEQIELCAGMDGKRQERDRHGWPIAERPLDAKNRDKSTHLWAWYQAERPDEGAPYLSTEWQQITEGEHGAECAHCYAAHVAVQRRKEVRRELGNVKATMSRVTE